MILYKETPTLRWTLKTIEVLRSTRFQVQISTCLHSAFLIITCRFKNQTEITERQVIKDRATDHAQVTVQGIKSLRIVPVLNSRKIQCIMRIQWYIRRRASTTTKDKFTKSMITQAALTPHWQIKLSGQPLKFSPLIRSEKIHQSESFSKGFLINMSNKTKKPRSMFQTSSQTFSLKWKDRPITKEAASAH